MSPGGNPFFWGVLLFLAGLIIGAFGAGVVFESRDEGPDVAMPSTNVDAHTSEIDAPAAAGLVGPASPLQEVGDPARDVDQEPPSDANSAVIAIGQPLDADAELSIPSSSDNDEVVVQIGESRDVDAPP